MKKIYGSKNQNLFSIIVSLIFFSYSFLIMLLGVFTPDVLYSYGVLYPLLLIISIIIIIYAIITHKQRCIKDYIIICIIFLAVLTINIQCFMYFYRIRTGDFYYSLYYEFPGILKFNTNWLVSIEPYKYEPKNTILLFDPILVSSVFCVILSL